MWKDISRSQVRACVVWGAALLITQAGFADPPPPAEAAPQATVVRQLPESQLHFPVHRDWVEVPFRLYLNKIIVPVTLNGAGPFDFVLDTGASSALLHAPRLPDDLDLEIVGQAMVQGAGHGGAQNIDVAGNVTFGLGEVELRQGSLAVAPGDSSIAQHMGAHWQGVFGGQVFRHLVVEINWTTQRLRLHHPERFTAAPEEASLPLERQNGHAFVQAELDVDGQSARSVRMVLDTGAYHAIALGGIDPPEHRLDGVILGRGLGGRIHGSVGRIAQLKLGPFTFERVVTSFPEKDLVPIITSGSDGNLGSEVLRRFTLTFDFPGQRMLLRPNDAFEEPFRFSTSGLRARTTVADDGGMDIDDVYKDSPAHRAGITTADRLMSIDGLRVEDLTSQQLLDLLQGDAGNSMQLGVQRPGQAARQVTLTLRELL